MKKIVLTLLLAAIMILSGCYGFVNPVSNPEISESLVSRMKNNIETHSIEGFTGQSSFADVLAKMDVKKISHANLIYNSVLLGYPAVMLCSFYNYKDKLLLGDLHFEIIASDEGADGLDEEKLLAMLDAGLGDHKKYTDEDGYTEYIWEKDGWRADISFYKDDYESNNEANISVYAPMVLMGELPRIPDIFPYQFGTDVNTVYQNETPSILPEEYYENSSIDYEDDGIEVSLNFATDETGAIKLRDGSYNVFLNNMDVKSSLDYFETLADGLEAAIGEPDNRGYGIQTVYEDETGITTTYGGSGGGQGLSAEDILNSGSKYYWLGMNWPGIDFTADYGMGVDMSLYFSEEYLGGTASE